MEKKVRYLMLLLCLFMFPFRVYAADEEVFEQSNVVVEEITEDEIDNQIDQQDLELYSTEDVEETEEVEDTTSEEVTEEESIPEVTSSAGGGAVVIPDEEGETSILIDSISLTLQDRFESFDLEVGGAFPYVNTEYDGYKVTYQGWHYWNRGTEYVAETIEEGITYNFVFAITVEDGYKLKTNEYGVIQYNIEGTYEGYLYVDEEQTDNVYYIYSNVYSLAPAVIDANDIVINGTFTEAYIDEQPIYGATTSYDAPYYNVTQEFWITESCDEEGVCTQLKNTRWSESGEGFFEKFEAGNKYSYGFIIRVIPGSSIDLSNLEDNTVEINGIRYTIEDVTEREAYEGDMARYYQLMMVEPVDPQVLNIYEVTENPDTTLSADSIKEDVTIDIDDENAGEVKGVYFYSEYEDGRYYSAIPEFDYWSETANYIIEAGKTFVTFTKSFLDSIGTGIYRIAIRFANGMAFTTINIVESEEPETTTTETSATSASIYYTTYERVEEEKDEEKLEVKKDKEEEKDEEIEKEKNSNIGLIIFLIILVIIAIAIPVTIYRKKQ